MNFEFKKGKINIIIGTSGSGKSTIIKSLVKLIEPSNGNIIIDNNKLKDINTDYLRNNISVVNQNVNLFNLSVYENINYNNNIPKNVVQNFVDKHNLNNTIFTNITLDTISGVNGSNLSNGQRQLILILREYFKDKKILLMDEPTSSLDINTKKIIVKLIKDFCMNKTLIITTHDDFLRNKSEYLIDLNVIKNNKKLTYL